MSVDEQASHVALSCRRIFDHVADAIPASPPTPEGISLGPTHYKNRLVQYLKVHGVGDTERDVIVATVDSLCLELDCLNKLSNKGVHAQRRQDASTPVLVAHPFWCSMILFRCDRSLFQYRSDPTSS